MNYEQMDDTAEFAVNEKQPRIDMLEEFGKSKLDNYTNKTRPLKKAKLSKVSDADVRLAKNWSFWLKANRHVTLHMDHPVWEYARYMVRTYTTKALKETLRDTGDAADIYKSMTDADRKEWMDWAVTVEEHPAIVLARKELQRDTRINIASGEDAGDCWED